jgi:phage protein D/phage baseplate assembly protein gpV
MTAQQIGTDHLKISIDGAEIAAELRTQLLSVDTESTYNRPDEAIVTFSIAPGADPPAALDVGKAMKLAVTPAGSAAPTTFFEGEVTALETEFTQGFTKVVVLAHDKLHRMFRGDKNKTYKDIKISDIASQMASEHSMSAQVTATTDNFPSLWQHNETDGDFLTRLAGQVNSYIKAEAGKLVFAKIGAGPSSSADLVYGEHLLSFNTRATAKTIVKEVEVRGWDVKEKKAIVGKASSSSAPFDQKAKSGAADFGATKVLLTREGTQSVLDEIAKSSFERAFEQNLQAEGTCYGDARLKVDTTVKISGVGQRFSGEYRVSQVRHTYSDVDGFKTEFSCRGGGDQSLANLVSLAAVTETPTPDVNHFDAVVVGIVTNIDDPDKIGRVRVKLPHIADDQESHWMRTVHAGAGGADSHGMYILPEVDDEVLVAFEHGDPRRGFVLGGLYNGKDAPPEPNGAVIDGGKVNQRLLQTRVGSFLLLDDKSGKEAFELKLKGDNFHIRFEEGTGLTLTSKAQGNEILITPQGEVTIKQAKDVTIESTSGKLSLKAAQDISIESTGGKITAKAAMDASLEGMNVKVEGQMNAEVKGGVGAKLEGGATATVKGGMVMIN